jgi:hypothetical protein
MTCERVSLMKQTTSIVVHAGARETQKIMEELRQLKQEVQRLLKRTEGPLSTVLNPLLPTRNAYGGLGYVYSHEHGAPVPVLPTPRQLAFPLQGDATVPLPQPQPQPQPGVPQPRAPASGALVSFQMHAAATMESSPSSVGPAPGCRAIPTLSTIGSWVNLYKLMYVGASNEPALLDLEDKHGPTWRKGAKKRWHEIKVGWQEILRVSNAPNILCSPASSRRIYRQAADRLDAARADLGAAFPTHLKKYILQKHAMANKCPAIV